MWRAASVAGWNLGYPLALVAAVHLLQPDPDGTPYIWQPDPLGVTPNPLYALVLQDDVEDRARTLGSADLRYVRQVARQVGQLMTDYKIVVDKSTVPVGTATRVHAAMAARTDSRKASRNGECSLGR